MLLFFPMICWSFYTFQSWLLPLNGLKFNIIKLIAVQLNTMYLPWIVNYLKWFLINMVRNDCHGKLNVSKVYQQLAD